MYWDGLCGEELRAREGEGMSALRWTEGRRPVWRSGFPASALGQERGSVLGRGWRAGVGDSGR